MPVDKHLLQSFYLLDRLIEILLPKLFSHFKAQGVGPAMFASEWFGTLFSRLYPISFVLPLWDVLLLEDYRYIYRISVAILKLVQSSLLSRSLEDILRFLKEKVKSLDPFTVIHTADSLNLDAAVFVGLEAEFLNPVIFHQEQVLFI